jgi:hypothetical protein
LISLLLSFFEVTAPYPDRCLSSCVIPIIPNLLPVSIRVSGDSARVIRESVHSAGDRESSPVHLAIGKDLNFAWKKGNTAIEFLIQSTLTEKYNVYPIYFSDEVGLYIP